MVRAILAVIVGIVLWGGMSAIVHAVLMGAFADAHDVDEYPQSAGILVVYLGSSVVQSALAGYVAAWITTLRPMRVVLILAAIQLVIGIAVQASVWELMPVWYHIPFLLMVVPAHVLGGWLRIDRKPASSS